jgi:hypothetical protein
MNLTHYETRANVEADVEDGAERLGDLGPLKGLVAAFVNHLLGALVEEEREKDTRQDEDDEAVQRDFSHHERPMIGEDLVEGRPRESRSTQPVVEPARQSLEHG